MPFDTLDHSVKNHFSFLSSSSFIFILPKQLYIILHCHPPITIVSRRTATARRARTAITPSFHLPPPSIVQLIIYGISFSIQIYNHLTLTLLYHNQNSASRCFLSNMTTLLLSFLISPIASSSSIAADFPFHISIFSASLILSFSLFISALHNSQQINLSR